METTQKQSLLESILNEVDNYEFSKEELDIDVDKILAEDENENKNEIINEYDVQKILQK